MSKEPIIITEEKLILDLNFDFTHDCRAENQHSYSASIVSGLCRHH